MSSAPLSDRDLASVAARFKLLAEPARLSVLQRLQHGPQHVGALIAATGLRQANLSKHLQTLHAHGLVSRARQGRFVHYTIADPVVVALCDLMCRSLHSSRTQSVTPAATKASLSAATAGGRRTRGGPGERTHRALDRQSSS